MFKKVPNNILILLIVLFMSVFIVSIIILKNNNSTGESNTPYGPGNNVPKSNPFGVSIDHRMTLDTRIKVAKELGVKYYRTSIVTVGASYYEPFDIKKVRDSGFQVELGIRNRSSYSGDLRDFANNPDVYPADMNVFRTTIAKAIDDIRPYILIIGNEAGVPDHFSGTPEQYEQMLKVGCEVSRSKNVPCASDGLLSGSVVFLTYYNYLETNQTDKAKSYRERAFESWQKKYSDDEIEQRINKLKSWISAYKNAAPDYVNMHWYVSDAQALEESVRYMEQAVGKPVISNETGQRNEDAAKLTSIMQKYVDLNIPFVTWYSSTAGAAQPTALQTSDGTLTNLGAAFKDFISKL